MLISLFITCYNDTLFPETGKAVVTVLERLGHQVEFREAQTCCGQMHFNTGYPAEALTLMRRMLEVFRGVGTHLRAVGVLRGDDAGSLSEDRGRGRRRAARRRRSRISSGACSSSRNCWSTSSASPTSAPRSRTP